MSDLVLMEVFDSSYKLAEEGPCKDGIGIIIKDMGIGEITVGS